MLVVVMITIHLIAKIYFFSILKVRIFAVASIVSLAHDVFFVFPFLILPFLNIYSSATALSVLITLEWAIIFGLIISTRNLQFNPPYVNRQVSRILLVICSLGYFLGVVSQNPTLHTNLTLEQLFAAANANSIARYGGDLFVTSTYKVGVVLAFGGALLGGYISANSYLRSDKIYAASPVVVGLIDAIVMGARSGFMMLLLVFLVSAYAARLRAGRISKLSYSDIGIWIIKRVVLIFSFFVGIQFLRTGNQDADILGITSHVLTWFFGHVSAFSTWFDTYTHLPVTFGGRTFSGITSLLGLSERTGGTYDMVNIGSYRQSNVFTAYRGLIEDYTLIGAHAFIFLLAVLLGKCLVLSPKSAVTFGISVIILTFFAWSFVISIWTYNSIVFGQIVAIFFVRLSSQKLRII